MTELTFQPALDPLHAVFRFLRLLPIIRKIGSLPNDHVRILDFYLLFPFQIGGIRLKPKHRNFKKLAITYAETRPYGHQPEKQLLFDRMQPMQAAALDTLASHNLIADTFHRSVVTPTHEPAPSGLAERVSELNRQQSDLIDFLTTLASEYELGGPSGIKARTELMDYRTDAF